MTELVTAFLAFVSASVFVAHACDACRGRPVDGILRPRESSLSFSPNSGGTWFLAVTTGHGLNSHIGDFLTEEKAR
jgi:hypothetical protein